MKKKIAEKLIWKYSHNFSKIPLFEKSINETVRSRFFFGNVWKQLMCEEVKLFMHASYK